MILEVLGAVKRGLPDAGVRPPGEVMSFVLAAIRAHDAKVIEEPITAPNAADE